MSLIKVTVETFDGYGIEFHPSKVGVRVLNTNRMKRIRDAGSSKTEVFYLNNELDRNESGNWLLLDETYANIKTAIKATTYEYLTLPFYTSLSAVGSTTENLILTKDFYIARAEDSSTSVVEYLEGAFKKQVKLAALDLDAIANLSTGGSVFTVFQFLDADNAALSADAVGVIDHAAKTIAVDVPAATVVTALVANFTINGDATAEVATVAQVSSTTANDFTAAVDYDLVETAATPLITYEVTVTVLP